ncbi:protein of unknown function DUF4071 [Trinorchestia longiramus]|nr:protein of unknown function DUF4071 [Trinorchestia longiramus]
MPLNVVCILDALELDSSGARKLAFEAIKDACHLVEANFNHLKLHLVNFLADETNELDKLYNADVAIVDLSLVNQQCLLFYLVGVRESLHKRHTIILYNDNNAKVTESLKCLCSSYSFVSYQVADHTGDGASKKVVLVTDSNDRGAADAGVGSQLSLKLQQLLGDAVLYTKAHMKEKFLADLRKAREVYSGADLKAQLTVLRKRLDDPNILSGDVVLAMLSAFRDIEDHDAMVQFVDFLKSQLAAENCTSSLSVLHLFCFALNRRNHGGDRERARSLIKEALDNKFDQQHDIACLYGRMHKDKFVESGHTDQESLNNAIFWYRKGFENHPNEYAGINLATLLVIAGNDFAQSSELQHIVLFLYNQIGKKGSLDKLEDYWDVAIFFEISVLAEDYGKAVQAAEYMFKLKPLNWQLMSTMGNIALIQRTRKPVMQKKMSAVQCRFDFWISFFNASSSTVNDFLGFPVLVMERTWPPDCFAYQPSYISLDLDAREEVLRLQRLNVDNSCEECCEMQDLVAGTSSIKSVGQQKQDARAVLVGVDSDLWLMVMPCEQRSARFCDLLQRLLLTCKQRTECTQDACAN